MNHTEARGYVSAAFSTVMGRAGTVPELQCLQAIGWLETNYGAAWHGPGVGSFNMGAIQKGSWPAAIFAYTDTHPNADGTSTPYSITFRKYKSAQSGFEDLCRVVYLAFDTRKQALIAAGAGDLLAFSTWLHKYPCYYEGFGATDADRIAHHHTAVVNAIKLQCAELGEQMPETAPLPVIAPALLLGCKGPAVGVWQKIVGAVVDDDFGMGTQAATRAWQTTHGLPASGVVTQLELEASGLAAKRDTEPSPPPDAA